jgi:hypothetical protein
MVKMQQIEYLRQKLYEVIETGITEEILKVSQEMDELILDYMNSSIN